MRKSIIRAIIMITVALLLAFGIAKANEPFSLVWNEYSIYTLAGLIAFVINWIVFIPSYFAQTEKYYDLTGSISYLSVLVMAFVLAQPSDNPRALLIIGLVVIWTIRLGTFLFRRISKDGGRDRRFDELKKNFLRFLAAWTVQGLWVFLTLCAGLAVITSSKIVPLDIFAYAGLAVWGIGFSIEVLADRQKSAFKADPSNKGKFISTGLWAYSRHPNYFGEITLWTGIFIMSIPVLEGMQWVTIISPIFVYLLLNYISGINLLEAIADKRWGGQAEYETYKSNTSVLIPMPKKN